MVGPNFSLEEKIKEGAVCGIDEVGRGPLCGPVVAACVYVPQEARTLPFWAQVKDSKKLSAPRRAALFEEIVTHAFFGIGESSVEEIDTLNILNAALLAMTRAYDVMQIPCALALVDGNRAPLLPCPVRTIIRGDALVSSIAAASILAKVRRDQIMSDLAQEFPEYGWGWNAGYGTAEHLKALSTHGATPYHRRSFAPVKRVLGIL